jgi:two-component system, LytTR family, sensor kinase
MKMPLKIIIHVLYWFVFSMFSIVFSSDCAFNWQYIHSLTPHFLINLTWAVIVFYLFYFYFIRFFERKRLSRYLLYSMLTSISLTVLMLPLHKFFYSGFDVFDYRHLLPPMAGTFFIAQCGSLVRGFENWFSDIQLKNDLENRNLRNELELLRSQINPHFLFNALNNIDSLIHTNPKMASDSLVTLSAMMRYMIYETRTDEVSLDKELQYIRNYIHLQQLRYRSRDYVMVSLPGSCSNVMVAPMILIPFIENAFKYAYNMGEMPAISITLICHEKNLFLRCRNYCNKTDKTGEKPGGFGLENARKRLALLYPGKHELLIFDNGSEFKVELNISMA